MKTKIKYTIQTGIVALAATMTCGSCSDTWDDHYNVNATVSSQSLWETINEDPTLKPFARVLDSCNYRRVLDAEQVFTVWAPVINDARADELIARYQSEKSQNVKDEDNTVIQQFIKNHIALYNHQLSSLSEDTVTMMNGKRMTLTAAKFNDNVDIAGRQIAARNGALYKLSGEEDYFANVWEALQVSTGEDDGLDSLANFISSFNEYYFDANSSVQGGVVDGEIVYLDSVTYLVNSLLNSYGRINDEDSLFWLLAPTNKVWREKLDQYSKYFEYQKDVKKRDSLQNSYARLGIINDIFFNMRFQETSVNDSIYSTSYSKYQLETDPDERYGVFYKPFEAGGLFDGLANPEVCSNGRLYKATDWRIIPEKSFVNPIRLEGEWDKYYQLGTSITSNYMIASIVTVPSYVADSLKVSNNRYLSVRDRRPAASQKPSVTYDIPNTLSNCPYDIKVIFASPKSLSGTAASDTLPRKIKASIKYYRTTSSTGMIQRAETLGTVITSGTKTDTLSVVGDEYFSFPVCNFNEEEIRVQLILESDARSNEIGRKYSNDLLIDRIILEPRITARTEDEN